MDAPQVQSPNTLTIDFADNPKLREIFARKEVGDDCKLTVEIQVMEKKVDGVVCSIEKVVTDPNDYYDHEAEPTAGEPIMMVMMRGRSRRNHGMVKRAKDGEDDGDEKMGPHNRPPQTAENVQEPWKTAYA